MVVSNAVALRNGEATPGEMTALERVVISGDLSNLSNEERWSYYLGLCRSVGLNPFTQPFEYLKLNGKLILYPKKGTTDQLRDNHRLSIGKPSVEITDGLCIVTVTATDPSGRTDSDLGIVAVENLRGDVKANAIMKAITKAKRRVTLSMVGLGMMDETEVETIPGAQVVTVPMPAMAAPEPTPDEQDRANEIMGSQPAAKDAPKLTRDDLLWAFRDLAPRMVRAGHPDRRYATWQAEKFADERLAVACEHMYCWLRENAPEEERAHIEARAKYDADPAF